MITLLEKPTPFDGGLALTPHKTISSKHGIEQAPIPPELIIPIQQYPGATAEPIVQKGEYVLKGQVIAKTQGYIGISIHASTSGTVIETAKYPLPHPEQERAVCITIETDGKDNRIENASKIEHYHDLGPPEIQRRLFSAGIVSAGFKMVTELPHRSDPDIALLILNGVECEPYVSCDETLIHHRSQDVIVGLEILAYALQVDKCVIAIEENKTETIAILQQAIKHHTTITMTLIPVSAVYPSGAEKLLIQSITGINIPADQQPTEFGIICCDAGTTVAVKRTFFDMEPPLSRIVTVTGEGINNPCNIEVLIGTPIKDIIRCCGGYSEAFEYLIAGGPMTGFQLHNDEVPLIKTINCLLAAGAAMPATAAAESPCIRCNDCTEVCPVGLQAHQLHWYTREFNPEYLSLYHLFDCIECGCCAYVCPSHIPLVDNYRRAKKRIRSNERKRDEAERNKKRYEAKLIRTATEKRFKDRQTTKDYVEKDLSGKNKKAEIDAAVKRVQEKRKLKNSHR